MNKLKAKKIFLMLKTGNGHNTKLRKNSEFKNIYYYVYF